MIHYQLSANQLSNHWLSIAVTFPTINKNLLVVQLPSWRPGRYELGNFAKNVRSFKVVNGKGECLEHLKTSKDAWEITCENENEIIIQYEYFSAELNAGSTYIDEYQIYVNPVNCLIYDIDSMDIPCSLSLPDYGKDWSLAVGLDKNEKGDLLANNIHELLDSPFIYGNQMQKAQFESNGAMIHLWFHGICKPNYEQLESDFKKFISVQFNLFGEFAFKDNYHFLFHVVPYSAFHGVEHTNNTVIYLGPSYSLNIKDTHHSLLGISSHELFHSWNVKAIRPTEMHPYNYSAENYTKLGYVTEGFTTYYGDLILWRSDVWTNETYLNVLAMLITKHLHNFGRFNYSVAESSYDTWLDGYQAGAPDRKTSIYTEGAMVALLLDIHIIIHSNNKQSLDDIMRELYKTSKSRGYTEDDLKSLAEKFGGKEGLNLLEKAVYGKEDLMPLITEYLSKVGVDLSLTPLETCETKFGFKFMPEGEHARVVALYPNSIADKAGLVVGDLITRVNNISLKKDCNEWFNYFKDEAITIQVLRQNVALYLKIPNEAGVYFQKVLLTPNNTNAFFEAWKKRS
ncbi:MAG: putative metalloprotease with PDZ domain [Flavobacteriales bacterium]|jgi:predicted metalloprotease with PDZ domain